MTGKAHDNRVAYRRGARVNKLISGNEGPGVVMTGKTRSNHVLNTYIGVGRTGKCLLNKGPNVIDRGTANVFRGNTYRAPPQRTAIGPADQQAGLIGGTGRTPLGFDTPLLRLPPAGWDRNAARGYSPAGWDATPLPVGPRGGMVGCRRSGRAGAAG